MSQEVTRRITYRGDPAYAHMLVRKLEQEGVQVEWEPPQELQELRDMASAAEAVVASIIATGTWQAMSYVAREFRDRLKERGGDIQIEGNEDDD